MASRDLAGKSVIVGGAGLAGLSAARALERRGAAVTVVEARNRVGGRVWTIRGEFEDRQFAEAGADLIEHEQEHVLALAREPGLTPVRILRDGFGFYGPDGRGRRRGAVWDGNEQQRHGPAILSFLAGGHASKGLQDILRARGEAGAIAEISWLGTPAPLLKSHTVVWDHDPWVRGGYAYFDPGFDPLWRAWLARPAGRIVFAGEHTSVKSQGYMNGAIETGLRAAAEISAFVD